MLRYTLFMNVHEGITYNVKKPNEMNTFPYKLCNTLQALKGTKITKLWLSSINLARKHRYNLNSND